MCCRAASERFPLDILPYSQAFQTMVFPDKAHLIARMCFRTAVPRWRRNRASYALAKTATVPAVRRVISKHAVPSCIGLLIP